MRAWIVACPLVLGCGSVEQGEVTLAVDPPSVFFRRGETTMVQVTATDATGAVPISPAGLPAGVTADPLELSGNTPGMLVLRADATATQGIANVTVNAEVGGSAALRLLVGGPPGTLDESFADGGTLIPALNNMALSARGMVLTDRGLVITGFVLSNPAQTITIRVLEDGSLDPGFGTGGFVSTGAGSTSQGIAIASLADGRLIVAGVAGSDGTADSNFGLFGYTAAGALDAGFAASGVATFNPGTGFGELHNIQVAQDGSLVVGGTLFNLAAGTNTTRALRFSSNGVRDPSFDITESGVIVEGSALQPDGKLLLVGQNSSNDFFVARYNPDGTRDSGFGTSGVVGTDFGADPATANGVVLLPGGKLLVVGTVGSSTATKRICLAGYNANGSLDVTFGSGGKVTTNTTLASFSPTAVVPAGTQTLFVGKQGTLPTVVRLDAAGMPDAAFGSGGVFAIDFGITGTTNNTGAFGVAVDPDGRILISGEVGAAGAQKLAVARVWP